MVAITPSLYTDGAIIFLCPVAGFKRTAVTPPAAERVLVQEEDTHARRREVDLQPLSMAMGGSMSICVHLYDVEWYVEVRSFTLRFNGRAALLQK